MNGSKMSSKKSKVVEQVSVGERLGSGEFKFVFIKGSNPALTLPNQVAVRAGLSREDVFVVVHETHWTETAKLADVVLPAATYLEKSDLNFSDHHLYTRLSTKAIEPLGECKHEIWVMQQLAERLRCEESWVFEDPWQALEKAAVEAFENGSFDDLLKSAVLKLRQRPANEYQTPSGKIELYSSKALEIGAHPLPTQLPLSARFRDVYGPIPQVVWINPADANNLGVNNGQDVTIFNGQGPLTIEVVVTERVSTGVLWSPRPLTGKHGVPLNSLASGNPQSLGSGPRLNSIRVRLEASLTK